MDWDHDGDLDLWMSNRNGPRLRFMRNDNAARNNFVSFRLTGDGKQTSCDAIGARVELKLAGSDKRLVRTLRAGEGFLSQSAKLIHFGLGDAEKIESVTVHWPGGATETFDGLAINTRSHLVQGQGQGQLLEHDGNELALAVNGQEAISVSPSTRVPLVALLPMPSETNCLDFDGQKQKLQYGNGKPTLLVMYGSWCAPCRTELKALTANESRIKSAGLEVVALAVDGIQDDSTPEAAQKLCQHLKFPFKSARATPEFAQLMTGYHHMLVALKKPLPIPCSFLIDGDGQLSVIYKGPIEVEQLLADVSSPPTTLAERWQRAAPLSGRMLEEDSMFETLQHREANVRSAMGTWFSNAGRFADAARFFNSALGLEPDFGAAHEGLAVVMDRTQQYTAAVEHYLAAIKQNAKKPTLHYNLGNIYSRFERMKDAETCYRRAADLNDNYKEAHMNLGVCLMKRNAFADAARRFQKVVELDPSFMPAKQLLQQARQLAK